MCVRSGGSQEYNREMWHIYSEYALVAVSHGYILKAHVNVCPLLNNVMTMMNAFKACSL